MDEKMFHSFSQLIFPLLILALGALEFIEDIGDIVNGGSGKILMQTY